MWILGVGPHPVTLSHCHLPSPGFAGRDGWGQWPGGCHQWVCPPAAEKDPEGQATAATGHPSFPFQLCHLLLTVTSLRLHPHHLPPLKVLEFQD